jgi:hypothetical protein
MTTFAEVRADLARVLDGVVGWSVADVAGGYVGDQAPQPYSFKVARPPFDPRYVFGEAKKQVTFTVTGYAPRAVPVEAELRLDALCEPTGTGSIIATVQTSTNWSVTIDYAQVVECGETQSVTWIDGTEYLVAQFRIEVIW